MEEIFPVLCGIVLGLATHAVRPVWLKAALIAVLGVTAGFTAAWVSGELEVSSAYLLIDIVQVAAAAVMTGVLVRVWLRRQARSLAR
jgi:hypothetical protein